MKNNGASHILVTSEFKGVKDTYDEAREDYVMLRGQYKTTYAINKAPPSYFRDENYILDFKGSEAQLAR